MEDKNELVELTAEIISAYVSNNPVSQTDLPRLIGDVYRSLSSTTNAAAPAKEEPVEIKPAISIRKSITPDHLMCLEDGKKF